MVVGAHALGMLGEEPHGLHRAAALQVGHAGLVFGFILKVPHIENSLSFKVVSMVSYKSEDELSP